MSVGGVVRSVSGSLQRTQMFRVSLQVFACSITVEWEADLTSEDSLAILTLNHPRVDAFEDGEAAWSLEGVLLFCESQRRMKPSRRPLQETSMLSCQKVLVEWAVRFGSPSST